MDETQALAESHNAEATNAVAIAEQAKQKASEAQMSDTINKALETFFETRKSDRFIDINRIPFICDDIRQIKKDNSTQTDKVNDIGRDLRWMKYIGGGFVTAAGLLALKSLGL